MRIPDPPIDPARIARFMDEMAIIRTMDTRANDHPPGAFLLPEAGRLLAIQVSIPVIGRSLC